MIAETEIARVSLDPFSRAFLADPFKWHEALRDAGPVFWMEHLQVFGVARHAEVTEVLGDHETYISSRGVGLSDFLKEAPFRPPSLLLEVDPPLHDRTRLLMNEIVALPVLKALESIWREKAKHLVSDLVKRKRFDAVTDLAEQFPMMIFPDAVGLMDDGREHLLPYAAMVFNAFGPQNDVYEDGMRDAKEAIEWVAAACKRENLKPGGWGEAVYQSADRGLCSHEEAERLVRSFLSAGVDTTVNGISNLMFAFAQFPNEWKKLTPEPKSTRKAFNEGLRWRSTVQTFFRTTSRDTEIAGVKIPEGSKVLTFLAAANRDPRRWENPDKFDLDRNAAGHVGFGHGIHMCLGQMIARMEADAVLAAMAEQVSEIRATGPAKTKLNNTLCTMAHLPIEVVPRSTTP